jgi:hypothetical protein
MATEFKPIINVNTGNSIQTLKELKDYIKQLNDVLVRTEKGTDQYQTTVTELTEAQGKLKEVMTATKSEVEAQEGSYNALVKQMAELKKEYKSVTSDFERATLAPQIKAINDQLKNMDEATGNFQRNVGNYTASIEEAANQVLSNLGGISPQLGKFGNEIKSFIPMIKTLNTTAISGLKGIKKAIAATGIGLLVIAVGELIAHWKDFLKIIGVSDEQMEKFKETSIGVFKKIVAAVVGVGNSIKEFLLVPVRNTITAFSGLGQIVGKVFKGEFGEVKRIAVETFQTLGDNMKKGISFKKNFEEGKKAGEEFFDMISERMKGEDQEWKEVHESIWSDMASELDKLNKKRDEYVKKAKGDAQKLAEIERWYQSERKKILDRANKTTSTSKSSSSSTSSTSKDELAEVQRKMWEVNATELEKLNKERDEYVAKSRGDVQTLIEIAKWYANEKDKIDNEQREQEEKESKAYFERRRKWLQEDYELELEVRSRARDNKALKSEDDFTFNEGDADVLKSQNDNELESYRNYITGKQELLRQELEDWLTTEARKDEIRREMAQNEMNLQDRVVENKKKNDAIDKSVDKAKTQRLQTYGDLASSVLGSIITMVGENTKVGKALSYANAIINTAQAAVIGYKNGMEAGGPFGGPALGAAYMAMAITAGMAQVATIAKTSTDGSGNPSGISASATPVNAANLMNNYQYTRQLTTEQEDEDLQRSQRVYVLESDITDTQRKVSVSEYESTF